MDAEAAGLIRPVLFGPRDRIEAVAQKAGIDLTDVAIEDIPDSRTAPTCRWSSRSKARWRALMKGSLHTDDLMGAVVKSACAASAA